MNATSIFATDFDGTLLRDDGSLSETDLRSLEQLRSKGCSVVLATGRSPFSLQRCLGDRVLPVDWYVLSSGAGVMNSKGTTRLSHSLSGGETLEVHSAFSRLGVSDISIQGPFPDAHFLHWMHGHHGDDFNNRLELYRGYSRKVDSAEMESSEVIGFVEPGDAEAVIEGLTTLLGTGFSIIRATSPIDHRTVWIEVFPGGVNKASACEFIRRELGVEPEFTAAVGNDWNDVQMLEWAGSSFLMENAPAGLMGRFRAVPSNSAGGVTTAAKIWLDTIS